MKACLRYHLGGKHHCKELSFELEEGKCKAGFSEYQADKNQRLVCRTRLRLGKSSLGKEKYDYLVVRGEMILLIGSLRESLKREKRAGPWI